MMTLSSGPVRLADIGNRHGGIKCVCALRIIKTETLNFFSEERSSSTKLNNYIKKTYKKYHFDNTNCRDVKDRVGEYNWDTC